MPIHHNTHTLAARHFAAHTATAIYRGARLVWQAVRSCFGRGSWLPKLPYRAADKWRANP